MKPTNLITPIDQLEKAKEELLRVNLVENELVYDYVFEALRLLKKVNISFSDN